MRRIIIICEGHTEKEFCLSTLSPHFALMGIYVQSPLIKKSMGGIVKWSELKKQILLHLKTDTEAYVTTLIDYYGIYSKHGFPSWDLAEKKSNKISRMALLEKSMAEDIPDRIRYRYLPYIQLHEFEGLLFNDIKIFHEQIPEYDLIGIKELEETFKKFDNPEMINNNRETSPSHRLERIIFGYDKVIYGNIIAEAIGLNNLRKKSPRFNEWITKIEALKPSKK